MDVLNRAWKEEGGPIFLSRNWLDIKKYLADRGQMLSKEVILQFLEKQKSSSVGYKNVGNRKLKETSKSFLRRPRFFASLQGDLIFLSSKRNYGTTKKYVMIICDILSRYILLEATSTKQFYSQQKAFSKIILRIKNVHGNFNGAELVSDDGGEWQSHLFQNFLKQYNIKSRLVKKRPHRESRGASACESSIRRIRSHLERIMIEKPNLGFDAKLSLAEKSCNEEHLSSIGMSANEALLQNPLEILMISESKKIQKRKFLREEIATQGNHEISIGSVVCIRLNQDKIFASTRKESFGFLSPYYVVLSVDKSQLVWTYRLGNLLTMSLIQGSYTFNELQVMRISYFSAVRKVETDVKKVIKVENDIVHFKIRYLDMSLCSQKTILN